MRRLIARLFICITLIGFLGACAASSKTIDNVKQISTNEIASEINRIDAEIEELDNDLANLDSGIINGSYLEELLMKFGVNPEKVYWLGKGKTMLINALIFKVNREKKGLVEERKYLIKSIAE